jgi:hypothetical protein
MIILLILGFPLVCLIMAGVSGAFEGLAKENKELKLQNAELTERLIRALGGEKK